MPIVDLYASDDSATVDDGQFDVTTEDYAHVLTQLLPEGFAWNWKPNGLFDRLRRAMSLEFSRVERRTREMLGEFDPRTADELIADWEELVRISTPADNLDDRRVAVHTKFTARVGATGELFILGLAANLGYPDAEITRLNDPFLCTSECTHNLQGPEGGWTFAWVLVANTTTDNDSLLEEMVERYARAHEYASVEFP